MENIDAALFLKKSRGTAVKGSGTCCSTSLTARGFDRFTSALAHPLKGRSHAIRKRLHRGCSVGPQAQSINQENVCQLRLQTKNITLNGRISQTEWYIAAISAHL